VSLREALATPESKRRYVRTLFHTIADRYDLITVLLSFGRDRRWKERLVSLAGVEAATRALDLACGTGDIAFALSRRGASVIGLDLTPRMIELACAKRARLCPAGSLRAPRWLVGDMMALPFAANAFDLVTTGYGVRNVPVLEAALCEIHRVLKPGGRFLALDFNRPEHWAVRAVYLAYLTVVGSALGLLLHGDPDTYRYIPETIRRYPGAEGVARRLREVGFRDVGWIPLLGGLMAINYGTR
jgi:ubiquinone/menaquinone biosynthesis methyltransferase